MSQETNKEPTDLVSNTTNLPSQQETSASAGLDLGKLTNQNWLYIKHFLETADIRKSYFLAGYESKEESAPYQLHRRLKPYLEEVGNLAVTSRLKLVADLSKVLSIPLVDKESLTVSEWLRVRKFAATLTPEVQSDKPKLSVLIINRAAPKGDNGDAQKGTNSTPAFPAHDVIDIEPSA